MINFFIKFSKIKVVFLLLFAFISTNLYAQRNPSKDLIISYNKSEVDTNDDELKLEIYNKKNILGTKFIDKNSKLKLYAHTETNGKIIYTLNQYTKTPITRIKLMYFDSWPFFKFPRYIKIYVTLDFRAYQSNQNQVRLNWSKSESPHTAILGYFLQNNPQNKTFTLSSHRSGYSDKVYNFRYKRDLLPKEDILIVNFKSGKFLKNPRLNILYTRKSPPPSPPGNKCRISPYKCKP